MILSIFTVDEGIETRARGNLSSLAHSHLTLKASELECMGLPLTTWLLSANHSLVWCWSYQVFGLTYGWFFIRTTNEMKWHNYFHYIINVLVLFHAVDLRQVSPQLGTSPLCLFPWQPSMKLEQAHAAAIVLLELRGKINAQLWTKQE